MSNEPRRDGDHDPPRPIVREVLAELLQRYISPLAEKIDELALSLKVDNVRDLVQMREALDQLTEENERLRHDNTQLETKVVIFQDARDSWKERHDKKDTELTDARLEIAFLKSQIGNLTNGET